MGVPRKKAAALPPAASMCATSDIREGDSIKVQYDSNDAALNLDYIEVFLSVSVTGVSLSEETLTLAVNGSNATLTATVAPEDAINNKVSWSSSDESVAIVSANGEVTPLKAGTATITVTTEDGNKQATCIVTVKGYYVITYDGNGSTGGTAPVDSTEYLEGTSVTVAGAGDLVKNGYQFNGWNTRADGTGTAYAVGAIFTMGAADITMYAQWIRVTKFEAEAAILYGSAAKESDSGSSGATAAYSFTFQSVVVLLVCYSYLDSPGGCLSMRHGLFSSWEIYTH